MTPFCEQSYPPGWCADEWCYVNSAACNKPYSKSVYFAGRTYSYFTCGAANTFDSWFEGGGDGTHALTELVTLMQTYTQTLSDTLEENFLEAVQSVPPPQRPTASATALADFPLTPCARRAAATGVGLLSRHFVHLY